MVTSPQRMACV